MTTASEPSTPSWTLLFGASLLIAPVLFVVAAFVQDVVTTERWKSIPAAPPVTAEPPLTASGLIAYVESSGETAAGCVFVVDASGTSQPRRLGCSGDGTLPPVIARISWSPDGDLEVRADRAGEPVVLPVDAGPPASNSIPEVARTGGLKGDGIIVRTGDRTDDRAEIVVTPPQGRERTVVSLDGPNTYMFSDPQWSPDGRWILAGDSVGRLLIVDGKSGEVRELLPRSAARRYLREPLLTWHQGVES